MEGCKTGECVKNKRWRITGLISKASSESLGKKLKRRNEDDASES